MTFYHMGYNRYNVTMKIGNEEIMIATIRSSSTDLYTVYINMHFPFQEHSEKKINTGNMIESEVLESAKKFIMKKLYRIQGDIMKSLQSIDLDHEKQKDTYVLTDVSRPHNIYILNDEYC